MILNLFYFFTAVLGISILKINQDYLEKGKLQNLVDTEYYVIQEIANGTMYFKIQSDDTSKYLQIELIFFSPKDGNVNFSFSIDQNSLPQMLENKTISSKYIDLNGDYLKKNYHHILIPAQSYNKNDQFYITNFKFEDGITYQYLLRINQSDYLPCPQNCIKDSYGSCLKEIGLCQCKKNRIDLDCSKIATQIMMDKKIENITIIGTQYFYFEQTAQLSKIQVDIEMPNIQFYDSSSISVYIIFENFQVGVPTEELNDQILQFNKNSSSQSNIIDISKLNYNPNLLRFNRLLFTFIVPNTYQFNINISLPSSDLELEKYKLVIIICVLVILVLLTSLFIYFRCKSEGKNKENISVNRFDFAFPVIQWQKLNEHPKIKKTYQEYDSCIICFLKYQEGSSCRVTPCAHVFHANCLKEWFVEHKHDNCPMCRVNFTSEVLESLELEIANHKQQSNQSYLKKLKNLNLLIISQNQRQQLSQEDIQI